jgi:hypothetical protein
MQATAIEAALASFDRDFLEYQESRCNRDCFFRTLTQKVIEKS